MTTRYEHKLFQNRNIVNEAVKGAPQYMNTVIADVLTDGHKEQMNADWLRRFLLQNVEDRFINYGQALTLNKMYTKIIEEYR